MRSCCLSWGSCREPGARYCRRQGRSRAAAWHRQWPCLHPNRSSKFRCESLSAGDAILRISSRRLLRSMHYTRRDPSLSLSTVPRVALISLAKPGPKHAARRLRHTLPTGRSSAAALVPGEIRKWRIRAQTCASRCRAVRALRTCADARRQQEFLSFTRFAHPLASLIRNEDFC